MNYIKFSFTLFMVVVSAFVMIYVVEGYYEARIAAPAPSGGVSVEAVRSQESVLNRVKGFFRQAASSSDAPVDLTAQKAAGTEVHHGLCVAAMTGDYEKTKMLLDAGVSANTRDAFGIRGITRATLWGHYEVVKLLLERGASVNEKERLGVTLLMLAANQGDEKLLRLFLEKGAEVKAKSEDGETALTTAVRKGHLNLVEILKQAGAEVPEDLNLPEPHPSSASAEGEEKRSIAERLFSRDRRASREHETGEDPLPEAGFMTAEEPSPAAVPGELVNRPGELPRALSSDALTWAANVSQASIQEKEPLLLPETEESDSVRLAPENPKTEIREVFQPQKPAAIEKPLTPPMHEMREMALEQALNEALPEPARPQPAAPAVPAMEGRAKKVDLSAVPTEEEMLEQALLNLNRRRSEPPKAAAAVPSAVMPAALPVPAAAEKKAVLAAVPEQKPVKAVPAAEIRHPEETVLALKPLKPIAETPAAPPAKKPAQKISKAAVSQDLLHACLLGDLARVRKLIDAGADVNTRGALDMTPLMIAAQDGHLLVVKALLQKGADIHAQNIVGQTALRLAMLREREAVIAVLRSAGARE